MRGGHFFLGTDCEEKEEDRIIHGGKMVIILTQKKRFYNEVNETKDKDAEGRGLRSGLEFHYVGSKPDR